MKQKMIVTTCNLLFFLFFIKNKIDKKMLIKNFKTLIRYFLFYVLLFTEATIGVVVQRAVQLENK